MVAFDISLSYVKTFYYPRRLDSHQLPPARCAIALLNPKTSRFVDVTCPAPHRHMAKKTDSARESTRLLRDLIYVLLQ